MPRTADTQFNHCLMDSNAHTHTPVSNGWERKAAELSSQTLSMARRGWPPTPSMEANKNDYEKYWDAFIGRGLADRHIPHCFGFPLAVNVGDDSFFCSPFTQQFHFRVDLKTKSVHPTISTIQHQVFLPRCCVETISLGCWEWMRVSEREGERKNDNIPDENRKTWAQLKRPQSCTR